MAVAFSHSHAAVQQRDRYSFYIVAVPDLVTVGFAFDDDHGSRLGVPPKRGPRRHGRPGGSGGSPSTAVGKGATSSPEGVESIKVDFKGKYTTIQFKEDVISAQQVARAMAVTPHMMGRDMQYGGVFVVSVAGVKDEAVGKKAVAALSKVEGVAKVTLYPQQQAVGIEFTSKGKVTSKQLIDALEVAGLKAAQYSTGR